MKVADADYAVTRSEAEWRQRLTPEQFHIMREHGTERAGSCALNYEKRAGVFTCAGCDQPLFVSKKKFESGTGWPSFNDPEAGAVETTTDRSWGMSAHRGSSLALRLASRPCLRRRPAADRPALLHQRRGDEFHAGLRFGEAKARVGRPLMNAPPSSQTFRAADARPAGHPDAKHGRIGVLLVNLGTPEATDYWSMRRYLKEFLSDRRVIETPRLIWWPLLNLVILSRRPLMKGRDYDAIWNKERNESPLKTTTRASAEKLAAALAQSGDPNGRCLVDWAMRYGQPAIGDKLKALQAAGCDRILLVPLYPQYCAATTATVCDKAFETLKTMRWQPALRIAAPYYDDPVYIGALAQSARHATRRARLRARDHPDLVPRHSAHLFR